MTVKPTMQPITSLVPTSAPSLTGLVALFDFTKVVTSTLGDSEISSIQAEVMENFSVSEDAVDSIGNAIFVCKLFQSLSHLFFICFNHDSIRGS